jgi:hypothetical protein
MHRLGDLWSPFKSTVEVRREMAGLALGRSWSLGAAEASDPLKVRLCVILGARTG